MNLRQILLGTAVALSPSLSLAADLPRRAAPAPVFASAPFSWTGAYVGLNAGFGALLSATPHVYSSGSGSGSGASTGGSSKNFARGVFGGAQVGYNQQVGSLVLGVEADIGASSAKSRTLTESAFSSGSSSGASSTSTYNKVSALGTLRGRIGFAADKALFYVTGGLAFGRVQNSISIDNSGDFSTDYSFSQNKWKYGWAAGAGAEYALNNNWSIKAEAIYFDLGKTKFSFDGGKFAGKVKNTGLVARAGVNYRF